MAHVLVSTRLSLHGIAELVLAGPQFRRSNTIELRATAGGFGTVAEPDLRVEGVELVVRRGHLAGAGIDGDAWADEDAWARGDDRFEDGELRLALTGTFAELAEAAGVEASPLDDVYSGGPGLRPDQPITVDAAAAARIADAFAIGDEALRALVPGPRPILWPEHFDIGITEDEVNYGVSPGDDFLAVPYAYVGPWKLEPSDLWNAPFGAARPLTDLPDAGAVLAFFQEIRTHLHP